MDQYPQDSFPAETEDGAHNRLDARDSMFLMADFRLEGSGTSQAVRVRNLSAGGLMAEFPSGLGEGTRVEIDVRGVGRIPGQVAWSTEGRIGVAFDRTIDPILARKPVGGGAAPSTYVKPVLPRGSR